MLYATLADLMAWDRATIAAVAASAAAFPGPAAEAALSSDSGVTAVCCRWASPRSFQAACGHVAEEMV